MVESFTSSELGSWPTILPRSKRMSMICICGICIPYTVLWPIVLLFLKQIWSFVYGNDKKAKKVDGADNAKTNTRETKSAQDSGPTLPLSYSSDMVWEEVISEDSTKVFRFTAKWCKPCKALDPIYEELSISTTDVTFYNVDVDECDEVAAINGAIAIPLFVTYRGGKQLGKLRSSEVSEITKFINECANSADITASE